MSPRPSPSAPAHATALWRVNLLGGLTLQRDDLVLSNLGSRSVAALLARLALFPQRSHAREELIELLWPGVALDVGRNRLRQALFTLRQLLEPPGPVPAPVLVADRLSVRVVPGAFDCDVPAFERCVREGRSAQALRLYAGDLMPGFYDEWLNDERLRLAALHEHARGLPAGGAPAPAAAPPAVAAPEPVALARSTLPVYLTRLFGRDADSTRLRAEVLGHRLVTLLGPGGSGKTRLAVELAATLRAAPGAGFDVVAFVSLVTCSSRAQLLDALLAALHLRQQDADLVEALVTALTDRRVLLVLDNFEQLCGLAEDVVAQLVARIPGLHLLVTSRRVLGLDGEREFTVAPLALPRTGSRLDEAAVNPAVSLFVDRARAARADFHIGPSNLPALVELVQLLEGMPLAIELAAARVRSIAPAAMVGLLRAARGAPGGRTLELLARSGPRSGADPRHASMLQVVDWSWRLLDAAQARLLAALTVFHGGFSAEAAQAVCGDMAVASSVQLDELVAHSLLRASLSDTGMTHYTAFEPVREYAALQLAAADAASLRARHRAWLSGWAATLAPTPALDDVRRETPNLLAALASALADGDPDAAVQMLLPLRRVLEDVELPADGLSALAQALPLCDSTALRSQGHTLLGPLLFIAGRRDDALRHAELGLAGAPHGARWRARALYTLARVRWRTSRLDTGVSALLDEAEPLAHDAADPDLPAQLHTLRAQIADFRGEHAQAQALHLRALALQEPLGNQHALNRSRYDLAVCAQNAGRHGEALQRLAALEPGVRRLQDWRRLSQLLNVRGNAQSELRCWPEAVASFRESARLAWDCLALHELAYALWNLPRALAHLREAEDALQVAGFAEALWHSRFGSFSEGDVHDMRRVRRLAACQIDAARVELLWAQGTQLPLAQAMALALH